MDYLAIIFMLAIVLWRLQRTVGSVEQFDMTVYIYEQNIGHVKNIGHVSGIWCAVFDSASGSRLSSRFITTSDAGQDEELAALLAKIRENRLVIFVGTGDFLRSLYDAGADALRTYGSVMVDKLANYEPWFLIGRSGRGPLTGNFSSSQGFTTLVEGTMTLPPSLQNDVNKVMSAHHSVNLFVPIAGLKSGNRLPEGSITEDCDWYAEYKQQARFCQRYEGYESLCLCVNPLIPALHSTNATRQLKVKIPIIILTATRPWYLFRILQTLWQEVQGFWPADVLVVVDGPRQPSLELLENFPVSVIVHTPQGNHEDNTRTNTMVAFGLKSGFQKWPEVEQIIVLEDDLIPSPDLLTYFEQLAPVLTADPTLMCANAFSQHSYPNTAYDLTTVLRTRVMPQYGWMMTRSMATALLQLWVPVGPGRDWDWWLLLENQRRNRLVLTPEVSRIRHDSSSGAHVYAWEQGLYHADRLQSNYSTAVLANIDRLSSPSLYDAWYCSEILRSTPIIIRDNPCDVFPLPDDQLYS
ncbi:protein O-linked-mannose beta-1,2-N-acetylglucosaminyltransferase 1 [Hyalella azteca]|uniref:Alpha-1,3-mannosyl-glycoprotein 2-beta-N-acetylglucosaminyltransferase n=1 Tax=Hyalella azteca TaxID=294128 RepID=A0A979FPN5_HYAAZ|nr:protein O-linked-mannose beta-1,2-N-acetylglucosaminyltransferase 1 [Hyalella azteca]